MLFSFFHRKSVPPVTYLECTGYSGIVYRVTGSGHPIRLSLVIESPGSVHRTSLTGFTSDVREAQALALALLEAGTTPEDLARLAEQKELLGV
ncbi:MAG: hypothetical protein IKN55_10325 [Oscillospiraceae bacterium]|nr:hypothetical protein [Oscillospiraceae bacterium]